MVKKLTCDWDGCNEEKVLKPGVIPQEGYWITIDSDDGKHHLTFCTFRHARDYVRKQVEDGQDV
ncbi:MAG: hypothetical protein M5U09_12645 [Gammaproteobacteria bacterium]|nr:hypothetical protein [Gammaproteobacteria bacterium]